MAHMGMGDGGMAGMSGMPPGMSAMALDVLQTALDTVRAVRCNVANIFVLMASGQRSESDGPTSDKDKNQNSELSTLSTKSSEKMRELEHAINSLTPPTGGPFNLGNSSLINQEVSAEKIPLYNQLIDSYKWLEKAHEYSLVASSIISQTPLKRSQISASQQKRKRMTNSHVVPPHVVDVTIMNVAKGFNDMEVVITRPLGSNAALCIALGRTLRSIVILKGLLIEWVVIRGFNEDTFKEDGSVDLWSESRFKVFQKITDNANGAMLHFYTPIFPELSIKSFMTWIHSYNTLFTVPCKKCHHHLLNNLPPTWRDLRTMDPYHEECKP